jgi:hypothetical protein
MATARQRRGCQSVAQFWQEVLHATLLSMIGGNVKRSLLWLLPLLECRVAFDGDIECARPTRPHFSPGLKRSEAVSTTIVAVFLHARAFFHRSSS